LGQQLALVREGQQRLDGGGAGSGVGFGAEVGQGAEGGQEIGGDRGQGVFVGHDGLLGGAVVGGGGTGSVGR
jgi:hypothetical protein